ncbi:recombinase RecA [Ideonella livida]|uniref:Recombinase RecA n=1 Tax=Ideonella livida TaxID=2707176 RepID=A0A7C9PJY6_9BURK|nr:recombinase RecA [Ideonella livida]NDY93813.1 recombinase RecA [Ideonella livida]
MSAVLPWAAGAGDALPRLALPRSAPLRSRSRRSLPDNLPPEVAQAVWCGTDLGRPGASPVLPSGWAALDAELPGGGWPAQSLTEVLCAQPAVLEWRLLGPVLRQVVAGGGQVLLVGAPRTPHLPGLRHAGLDERQLVWVQADTPAERLWCTEQLLRAGAATPPAGAAGTASPDGNANTHTHTRPPRGAHAVLAWLPQARPEQIRRLQVSAQAGSGLVFLLRPQAAQHEASAAPLRVMARMGLDWALQVQVFKRRGPVHEDWVALPSVPGGLQAVITPRLRRPSLLLAARHQAAQPMPGPRTGVPAATGAAAVSVADPALAAPSPLFAEEPAHALGRTAAATRSA